MTSGRAFVAETADGPTALVLLGHGRMQFTPPDPPSAPRSRSSAALKRWRSTSTPRSCDSIPVTSRRGRRRSAPSECGEPGGPADGIGDLQCAHRRIPPGRPERFSRDRWSLLPSSGDVIGELHSKKFGTLTYTLSGSDAEDITLFDRKQHHNISVYASPEKLAERGRSYSEDSSQDYDVLTYDIDAEFTPERGTVEGNARITLRMLAENASLSFHLADTLVVRGIYSPA